MTIMSNPRSNLPPGFRFHPTDEELILHYLRKKVVSLPVPVSIIADVDIYKFDPWELPAMSPFGEKEWYFFSPRDRKYPNGARPNRAAGTGYWKATGTDKIIASVLDRGIKENVGVKKALVFYRGRPPKGTKTNWIMHEYRLTENSSPNHAKFSGHHIPKPKESSMRLDDWVLCRIYQKPHSPSFLSTKTSMIDEDREDEEHVINQEPTIQLPSIPEINNTSHSLKPQTSWSFSNLLDVADLSILGSFLSDNQTFPSPFEFPPLIGSESIQGIHIGNYGNDNRNGYLGHKLPQLTSLSPEGIETRVKRQCEEYEDYDLHRSKKMFTSINSNNEFEGSSSYPSLHQQMLNQQQQQHQILLNPYFQYHG